MDALWTDLRYAVSALRRVPVFTVVVLATIACGTGATTVIVSLAHAVLLKPLPYPDPDRLVVLVNTWQGQVVPFPYTSPPRLNAWLTHPTGLREVAIYAPATPVTVIVGSPQQVVAGRVTASFFRVFGARLARGRPFTVDEDRPGGAAVAVVSYGLWQRQFGGAAVIGKDITINGEPATIVGVLDEQFDARSLFPGRGATPDLLLPLRLDSASRDDANTLMAVGRLDAGVNIAVARQHAAAAAMGFRAAFPGELPAEGSFGVLPLQAVVVGQVRPSLLLLLGAVGLVTILVCANTANLVLGRAVARRREWAIRVAVGASRSRLVRQLLTESLVLAAIGGLAGGVVAVVGLRWVLHQDALPLPRLGPLSAGDVLDVRTALLTWFVSTGTGVLFGVVPAVSTSRDAARGGLSGHLRMAGSHQHRRLHALLMMGETALACVLVIGAVLLLRSLVGLYTVDPGFERGHVLTMQSPWGERRLTSTTGAVHVVEQGLQRLTALPGVEAGAVSMTGVPLEQGGALSVQIVGRPLHRQFVPNWDAISPDYFEVFRVRLIRGRVFTNLDDQSRPPVAIINDAMARQLWPTGDPLRDRVWIGQGAGPAFEESVPREIIGVVGDVRQFGLTQAARPGVYVPLAQLADAQMTFFGRAGVSATWALRTRLAPAGLASAAARGLLNATGVPAGRLRTMDDVFADAMAPTLLNLSLMMAFGGLALLLAVLGLYAIAAYGVQQRTRELGIRLALGARASRIRNMVVWDSLRVALAGITIGMVAALALAHVMTSLLFEVTARDPLTLTIVPVLLVCASFAGVYVPARRAARVDPLIALRSE